MATGAGAILPQFQGDYYNLQNKQALAQALMGQSLQNQASQIPTNMPVMPKFSIGAGMAQLGQALLASRMENQVGQGYKDLGAQQWAAFGGGSPQAPAQTQVAQPDPTTQSAPSGSLSAGTSASPVSGGTVPAQAGPTGASAPQGGSGTSPMNPLGMPPGLAASFYSSDPGKYFETQAAAYKPADIVSAIRAAGVDPGSALGRQLAQDALAKSNYIAPTSVRPGGGILNPKTGAITMTPAPASPGFINQQDANGNWNASPIGNGPQAVATASKAQASGSASYKNEPVWDPTANNGQGGMVLQPATAIADAATGSGATTPAQAAVVSTESNGDPSAVSPKGAVGAWQVMPNTQTNPGFGVMPAKNNSPAELNRVGRDYYTAMVNKYQDPALGAIAYNMGPGATDSWIKSGANWESLPQETKNYVGKVSALTGVNSYRAAQPSTSIPSGAMAAAPPLGVTQAANSSQGAPSKLMADSYGSMSSADNNYQPSREALLGMMDLAKKTTPVDSATRFLPEALATRINSDATEYQKLHSTYVGLQGKALGSGGTDASRDTINNSVPTFDKPQAAKLSGLQTQLNNLDLSHLKTQFLTPTYQQGNEKGYTQLSAGFDQNIKPSMISVLQLSGDQQRAAVQAAVKSNPALKPNFEWAFSNGMLK